MCKWDARVVRSTLCLLVIGRKSSAGTNSRTVRASHGSFATNDDARVGRRGGVLGFSLRARAAARSKRHVAHRSEPIATDAPDVQAVIANVVVNLTFPVRPGRGEQAGLDVL